MWNFFFLPDARSKKVQAFSYKDYVSYTVRNSLLRLLESPDTTQELSRNSQRSPQ